MMAALILAAGLLLSLPGEGLGEAPEARIPLVGLDGPQADACSGIGRVTGLDPDDDYTLKVRDAPDGRGMQTDKLNTATLVWLCEGNGSWQGIVYAASGGDLGDCRVSSPSMRPEPYAGPCRHGWVEARYIQLIAG